MPGSNRERVRAVGEDEPQRRGTRAAWRWGPLPATGEGGIAYCELVGAGTPLVNRCRPLAPFGRDARRGSSTTRAAYGAFT
jgi:hypothetical protein